MLLMSDDCYTFDPKILKFFGAIAIVALLGFSAAALAHHSAGLYAQEISQVEGEVVSIKWRNPHVTWVMKVINASGEEELWVLEATSTYSLKRAEVGRELFEPGSRMKIFGRISTREQRVMLATDMQLPDWRKFLLYGKIARSFDDEGALVDAAADELGLFRVWSFPS